MVSVTLSSGIERNVHLVLDQKPTRINQKLKTLSQYIQKYPSGWKKRLKLANLLYATGDWERAIPEYHQVIERQPQLIEVQLKLEKMLQLMGQEADAATVYEKALSQVHNEATQQHINGLIALCRHDIEAAIAAFESATVLEFVQDFTDGGGETAVRTGKKRSSCLCMNGSGGLAFLPVESNP